MGRSEGEAGSYVLGLKRWKVGQDLRFGHSAGKIFEHVGDGDSRAFDARLAAAHSRRDRDVILELHWLK